MLKTINFPIGIEYCSVDGIAVKSGGPLDINVDVGQVNIRCGRRERGGKPPTGADTWYDRAEIGIDTNQGMMDVNLPPLELKAPQTVAELQQEFDGKLAILKEELTTKLLYLVRHGRVEVGRHSGGPRKIVAVKFEPPLESPPQKVLAQLNYNRGLQDKFELIVHDITKEGFKVAVCRSDFWYFLGSAATPPCTDQLSREWGQFPVSLDWVALPSIE